MGARRDLMRTSTKEQLSRDAKKAVRLGMGRDRARGGGMALQGLPQGARGAEGIGRGGGHGRALVVLLGAHTGAAISNGFC
jgi:hypothetical protein